MSFTLNAEARTVTGKKVKTLRSSGNVPAVLYGKGLETTALLVAAREFDAAYRNVAKGQTLTLQVGETAHTVVIQSVQRHPLSRAIIHVDFKSA
jgi:large subunit ribosomal protein L25